ncbi:TIGR02206 family membrane protein [candidate division KSB1 bacterium]|nr:TIGR02206 family membrane protein [candidate division KSB1 bacterium]NIR68577.1 TIGR02206 family membrane protein [candidate division KSB1 bacterium]NIS25414.1 TIGR02206 family membrane protein [candidate division KSB1 bacterium]NIT72306.1 TIGR02206 family membrane protein [candidate division KSB1 bacterium]NIU26090.1 TIGR02206 family membrane protein [candidate division KSB1 bacterium]
MQSENSFTIFGWEHGFALVGILVVTVGFPLLVVRIYSKQLVQKIAISLAAVILISKIIEPLYRILMGEMWASENVLPLHLCDVGGILAGIMLINRNYYLYELTYFWGFGGTLQAILTPDLDYGFPHMDFFFFFIPHGLIIVSAIFATVVFKYRPTFKSIGRAFVTTAVYAMLIAPVNWLLDTNFLYLCGTPEQATLLDYLGPWPWYLLSLIPVSLFLFFLYYSPFLIADLVKGEKALSNR